MILAVAAVAALGAWSRSLGRADRLRLRAEAAARAGDPAAAARAWSALNAEARPAAETLLEEARAWLAAGFAARAEAALQRACDTEPVAAEPWLLRLEILRVQDRPAEALRLGRAALGTVADPAGRRAVLRSATLALLADVPDDLARATLGRWVEADPEDLDARAALLRRIAAGERPGDPGRAERIATLEALLAAHPEHVGLREALVRELAADGAVERGRALLDTWPTADRDVRYYRLRGRWALDYDDRPADAADAFARVVAELPHNWQARYRLAHALQALGRTDEARAEAEAVARLRERLDPARLGARLDAALARLDADPAARLDLARLCADLGFARLAEAWREVDDAPGRRAVAAAPDAMLLPADLPARPRMPAAR